MTHKTEIRKNPLLTLTSKDSDRLTYKPILKPNNSSKPGRVSALEWLKHLESPDSVTATGKIKHKTERQRKQDLEQLEKFWKVAKGRAIFRKYANDPKFSNKDINDRIYEETGLKLSRQQLIFMRRSWDTEIQTHEQRIHALRGMILDYLAVHQDKDPKEIAEALGVTKEQVCHAIMTTGTSASDIRRKKTEEEQNLRKQFLDKRRVKYCQTEKLSSSIPKMEEILSYMANERGYTVEHYCPILACNIGKLDRNIVLLEAHSIPWDDHGSELHKLLGDKTETLMKKLELFDSVGASPELHYLLVGGIIVKTKIYSDEKSEKLRNAVLMNDFNELIDYARRIATHTIWIKFWSNTHEYYDVATDAAMTALAECKNRKNNPAATLAIMTVAVEMAVKRRARDFATKLGITEKNEDSLNHTCFRFLHEPDSSSLLESSP